MRRILLLVFCAAAALLSCDEAFDPQGEFTERSVLFCVMKGSVLGPGFQRAVLTRTVPGRELLGPSGGFTFPVIQGAQITLYSGTAEYLLVETLDTIKIGTPEQVVQFTYSAPSVSLKPSDFTSIGAILPDGRILSASTRVPPYLYFDLSYRFPHGFTTDVNPLNRGTTWTFSWEAPDGLLHFPELLLAYSVLRADSTRTFRAVPIPQRILVQGGVELPVYPQPTFDQSCGFDYATIDSVFARLAVSEGEFLELVVHSLRFAVVTFDSPLAQYYMSIHGSLDPYSIRIDETVYSNISGGIGVFGTSVESAFAYEVDTDYVESFGYVKN